MARLEVGASVETMPRFKRIAILHVLRPAESAFRRVIIVAIFVLEITAPELAERLAKTVRSQRKSKKGDRRSPPAFRLIDPRKRFDFQRPKRMKGVELRVTVIGSDLPIYDRSDLYAYQNRAEPRFDDGLSATRLCNRMNALQAALDDLPAQALRMAKLQARMERRFKQHGTLDVPPMRPGLPPGFRQRQKHEVDEILAECHRLALRAVHEAPDTS